MASESGGWALRRDERTGIYLVRFRHAGQRIQRSTGLRDRRAAQKEAARIYAEILAGRGRKPVGRAAPELEDLCGMWLADYRASHAPETAAEFERYFGATIIPFFDTLGGIDAVSCGAYANQRLRQVAASTVRKELSALRSFVGWLCEHEYLAESVKVPSVRKRAIGTPATKSRQVRVLLDAKQREALIAALPERSRRPRGHLDREPVHVRAFVLVMAETGLRRGTLWRLRAPEHFYRGALHLTITNDIDKARDGRALPLSPRARAALEAACPEEGLIFGRVNVRHWLAAASRGIGLPEHLAGRVSHHDLRHSFMTELAESGASLAGLQYLAGHQHASTSARYIHATQRAAEEALLSRDRAAAGTQNGTHGDDARSRRGGRKRESP